MQTADIEAFLNAQPRNRRRRLSTARQFFRWARRNKLVLPIGCRSTRPALLPSKRASPIGQASRPGTHT